MDAYKELALQKIGRNVVNFQKIEAMLKFFISRTNIKAPINKIEDVLKKRDKVLKRQSLGKLTNEYFKLFSQSSNAINETKIDQNEHLCSFSVKIEAQDGTLPQQKESLRFLVFERNRLIHQMLIKFNPDSDESCKELIRELDEQNIMIQREYKNIQNLLILLQVAKKELFEK